MADDAPKPKPVSKMTAEEKRQRAKTGAICGATKKNGQRCVLDAGWGTDHPGVGACKHHLGNAKDTIKPAAPQALSILARGHIDVSPMEALLMCVRITAAEVTYFSSKISELEEADVVERPRVESMTKDGYVEDLQQQKQLNIWIRERQRSLLQLARFSKMALDAGVEERMVRVAERVGSQIAALIRGVLDDLQLTEAQRETAPAIVRRHLRLLEGVQET